MPLLFSPTQRGLSDLKAGEVCQKQAEAVPEKPATSRLFNVLSIYITEQTLPVTGWQFNGLDLAFCLPQGIVA
ncbi:hypothetical protein [Pseudomonas sp. P7548]|uniref:hypothetical protein n=1 Tax=Pseudomonas sp. P7548 TaxID=2726981 RepID=UPI002116776E|nr:hypothetical protein [Pseudomonas sp. P7548]